MQRMGCFAEPVGFLQHAGRNAHQGHVMVATEYLVGILHASVYCRAQNLLEPTSFCGGKILCEWVRLVQYPSALSQAGQGIGKIQAIERCGLICR